MCECVSALSFSCELWRPMCVIANVSVCVSVCYHFFAIRFFGQKNNMKLAPLATHMRGRSTQFKCRGDERRTEVTVSFGTEIVPLYHLRQKIKIENSFRTIATLFSNKPYIDWIIRLKTVRNQNANEFGDLLNTKRQLRTKHWMTFPYIEQISLHSQLLLSEWYIHYNLCCALSRVKTRNTKKYIFLKCMKKSECDAISGQKNRHENKL